MGPVGSGVGAGVGDIGIEVPAGRFDSGVGEAAGLIGTGVAVGMPGGVEVGSDADADVGVGVVGTTGVRVGVPVLVGRGSIVGDVSEGGGGLLVGPGAAVLVADVVGTGSDGSSVAEQAVTMRSAAKTSASSEADV